MPFLQCLQHSALSLLFRPPVAHAANRFDCVLLLHIVLQRCRSPQRYNPLSALKSQAVAKRLLQAFRVNPDGLGIGIDGTDCGFEGINRYDVAHAAGEIPRKIDRIILLADDHRTFRSEEHTSELQSLMRISYAVFCLKKKKNKTT